jgi:hypothetical protein
MRKEKCAQFPLHNRTERFLSKKIDQFALNNFSVARREKCDHFHLHNRTERFLNF